jgi:hypothetical protein
MNITGRTLLKALVPYGLVRLFQARAAAAPQDLAKPLQDDNSALRGRHAGARCFILCTGPSVRKQDLRRLKGELVISVSSAYLHPDFDVFKPAYHCVPQITYGKITEGDVITWFRDMGEHIGEAAMILSSNEQALVESKGLFAGHRVHYLRMDGEADYSYGNVLPDLTGPLPGPQSVPIMALMLALYLGCTRIYLLGTDHDHFITGTYTHFYGRSPVSGKDNSVTSDGQVAISRYDELHAFARLWRQYRWLKLCAAQAGARIYNATAGGALDEFERAEYGALNLAGDAPEIRAAL